MKVPFIDLTKQTALALEDQEWIVNSIEDMEFIANNSAKALEDALVSSLSCDGTFIACANGTDALELSILALIGEKEPKKIGCPDLTFWASCEAIVTSGNIPVFIDADRTDYNLSFADLVKVHQAVGLDGLVLPHLFGWASENLIKIREFCESEGIALIEDAAQAYGVSIDGKSIFEGASVATLSFYPAKVLGGCMDGGAVYCRDHELAQKVKSLANHGRDTHYGYRYIGRNSRMSGVQARYLQSALKHVDHVLKSRRDAFDIYVNRLTGNNKIAVIEPPKTIEGNGYLQVLMVENADALAKKLQAKGIGTGRVYPSRMSEQKAEFNFIKPFETQNSKYFCERVLNLPLFYGVTEDQIETCCSVLLEEINT